MGKQKTFEIEVARIFVAPPGQLYEAWTDPDFVRQWWGPAGFTCPVADMDVRIGGVSVVAMRAPVEFGGADIHSSWTYTRVEPGRRLDFESRFVDAARRPVSPAQAGIPKQVPDVVPHIVTVEVLDESRSLLTVTEYGYTDTDTRDMSRLGLEQCLDKLARVLR